MKELRVGVDGKIWVTRNTFTIDCAGTVVDVKFDTMKVTSSYKGFEVTEEIPWAGNFAHAAISSLARLAEEAEAVRPVFWHLIHAYNGGMGQFRHWAERRSGECESTCL